MKQVLVCLLVLCSCPLRAQEKPAESSKPGVADTKTEGKQTKIDISKGKYSMLTPATWKKVEPKFAGITLYEFNYPADAKAGEAPVRITVSSSGGGIEGNLNRWYGQIVQPDGKATKDLVKQENFEAAGQKIIYVKIPGTYLDGSPMSARPATKRENYVMLGGIIETTDKEHYFVKLIGPAADGEKLEEGFVKMLKELKAN